MVDFGFPSNQPPRNYPLPPKTAPLPHFIIAPTSAAARWLGSCAGDCGGSGEAMGEASGEPRATPCSPCEMRSTARFRSALSSRDCSCDKPGKPDMSLRGKKKTTEKRKKKIEVPGVGARKRARIGDLVIVMRTSQKLIGQRPKWKALENHTSASIL